MANYITKAESTPDISDTILTAQLKVASGLGHLEAKKYKMAAHKFLECSPEIGSAFSDVATQQDVALYGGALVALGRHCTHILGLQSPLAPSRRGCYPDPPSAHPVSLFLPAAGLCALASFERSELKSKLIENSGFRTLLELYPEASDRPAQLSTSPAAPCTVVHQRRMACGG